MSGWWPSKVSVKGLVTALGYRQTFLIDSPKKNVFGSNFFGHFKLVQFVIVTHRKAIGLSRMRAWRALPCLVFARMSGGRQRAAGSRQHGYARVPVRAVC